MPSPLERLHAVETEPATPPARTLVSDAYQRLRADIVEGRLKPGTRLRAEHLKKDYQVGAATMREALALLVADALVVSREQRGFRVAPMSVEDFADITETRALLEGQAVQESILHGDDEWEAELTAAFHRLSRAEERRKDAKSRTPENLEYWEACNKKFHEALLSACGSRWTPHFLSILYRQSERYRRIAWVNAPPTRNVHAEHVAIFDAAIARDAAAASALIRRHIRSTLDVIRHVQIALPDENVAIDDAG